MALFDVRDINNPKELANTIIGDNKTSSAILTNPKALLFSREKNLIAIPVNNYAEDFSVNYFGNNANLNSSYMEYGKNYIAEGYLVYDISLEKGFSLKGSITHEKTSKQYQGNSYFRNYITRTRLLRGIYIDENLYTVSQNMVKVNKLENLEQICELKID